MGLVDALQQILGGQQQKQDYQDYVNRYNQGKPHEGYPDQEVTRRYNEIAPSLPPQDYRRAAEEAFQRMSPEERTEFARSLQQKMQQSGGGFPDVDRNGIDDRFQDPGTLAEYTARAHQQQPDIISQMLGPGGPLGSTAAKAAMAGIAAIAASKFLGRR